MFVLTPALHQKAKVPRQECIITLANRVRTAKACHLDLPGDVHKHTANLGNSTDVVKRVSLAAAGSAQHQAVRPARLLRVIIAYAEWL